jgi:hypothetical protein
MKAREIPTELDLNIMINQHNFGYGNDFVITINTALGTGNSFTLPLRSGYSYNFEVFWGDGSSSTITAYNDADITHTYSAGGVYQLRMRGTIQAWYFNNGGDKLKITKIDNWGDCGFTSLISAFYGCSNLSTSVAIKGFSGNSLQTAFYGCSSFNPPSDFFINLSGTINLQYTFLNCISLTRCPSISTISNAICYGVYTGCTSLRSVPEDYFYNNSTSSYRECFANCRNIVLPTRLFNLSLITSATEFFDFMYTGSASYSNTGTIQDIWNYSTSGGRAFRNQTALSNYASIPTAWK